MGRPFSWSGRAEQPEPMRLGPHHGDPGWTVYGQRWAMVEAGEPPETWPKLAPMCIPRPRFFPYVDGVPDPFYTKVGGEPMPLNCWASDPT